MDAQTPLKDLYSTDEDKFCVQRTARNDFYFFSRWMFAKRRGMRWQRAEHHKIVCDALERVFYGRTRRLIINIPPRYSKTELAVINFIPWALGHSPDAEFIHPSYSQRLAASNSWQARELVGSEYYNEIFPNTLLRGDSAARDEWRTTQGGIVYAMGEGGTITGYGAGKLRPSGDSRFGGAIIIDDPHKPDEIRHDIARKGVIEWFQNTLESRTNAPETPIILIMQRLHEEDLSGWLLAGGNGETWEHVELKALRNDGSALWPEKHDVEKLLAMQQSAPYTFSGQYQQRPTPPAGGIFKPDKIEIVDDRPQAITWVRAWDLAATQDDGDWTVGTLFGRLDNNRFVIADVVRLQGSPDEVEAKIVATAKLDGRKVKVSLPQDPGQAGKSQVLYLTKALAGFTVLSSTETGDKVTRAEPLASQVNVGNVTAVRGDYLHLLINELRNFPFGRFDDQVDSASRAFNTMMEIKRPMVFDDEYLAMSRMPAASYGGGARAGQRY